MMQQQGFDPRFHPMQAHQQMMMQQPMHSQIQFQQHHQFQQYQLHQQQQQQRALAERPKRPARNATKKKRVYDVSSEEEEEFDLESEESEAPPDSEFEDSDSESRPYKRKKQTAASAESEEPVMIPMGTKVFERILDYKKNDETDEEELLIKYKNTSFLHVEWVPLEQIEAEHLGKHRVKKFMQKYYQDGNRGEDFKEHLKIDRVIDDGELEDPTTGESKIYYLVKWNGLFYDNATWETEEDVRKVDSI
ncbi:Chromodomain-helicase-DNA-binding protein, partial [Rhizopus stolonifer]